MTDYEIAEQERATLYERIKLVKEEMQSIADPQELAKQKQRYSILYQMYQEALERKDAARPPAVRVRTAPKSRVTSFEARSADGTGTFNWLERNHVTFADIEGNTMRWEELGVGLDDGSKKARLIRALKRGKAICSDRQQQMLELSMEGKRVTEIAKILNVDKSTVSRTLNRAHQRIRDLAQFEEQYYEPDCDSEDSSEMDFADPETAKKLLGCLTERQAVAHHGRHRQTSQR